MPAIMLDAETLGVKPGSAIISIGAAIFDDSQIVDSDGWAIDPRYWHGDIDPLTVAWWAYPDRDGAREFSFSGKSTDFAAAFGIKTMMARHNVSEIFANDPEFDIIMLRAWWERIGTTSQPGSKSPMAGESPFDYKMSRSYRTIVAEARRLGYDTTQFWSHNIVAHNPIDDAVSQARVVIGCRKLIGGVGG